MEKHLVMFIGNSMISIVEQYDLHLHTNMPFTFMLPHKNDIVLKKLFNVLQMEVHEQQNNVFNGEAGSCYFLMDEYDPFMKTKREENVALVERYTPLFVDFAQNYDHIYLIGESSCSFDAAVIEAMLEQVSRAGKTAQLLSWCPVQSQLAIENDTAVVQAVQKFAVKHTVIQAKDENPDGFLSLFKAYNREIAQVVSKVLQQQ